MEKYEQIFLYKVTEIQNRSARYTEWKFCVRVCAVVHLHLNCYIQKEVGHLTNS